jgi:hypothetical protein
MMAPPIIQTTKFFRISVMPRLMYIPIATEMAAKPTPIMQ